MATNVVVRSAVETDLPAIERLVTAFVTGHPAENHSRSRERLRSAFFGPDAVANLVVASRDGEIIGMAQWQRIYDMFWDKSGAEADWLFVEPGRRGLGVGAALVAEICAQARSAGCEFVRGGANEPAVAKLYERVAEGVGYAWSGHVSAPAFRALAELAGLPPREIVRRLPNRALNRLEDE